MAIMLYLILFFSFFLYFHRCVSIEAVGMISKPGCQSKCGNVSIPFPFGIGPNCSFEVWANVLCDTTVNPPILFFGTPVYPMYQVVEFLPSEVRLKSKVASLCFRHIRRYHFTQPYTVSSKNKITVIGCNAEVTSETTTIIGGSVYNPGPSCQSTCNSREVVIDGESCSGGNGCCQTGIFSAGISVVKLIVHNRNNRSDLIALDGYMNRTFDPCYSAIVVDPDKYTFKISDFSDVASLEENTFLLNYFVGNKTCQDAKRDHSTFACKDNSYCYEPVPGNVGYLCNCSIGYRGNPYLSSGCKDVDECADPNANQCESTCINTQGNYTCLCPHDSYGDGRKDGTSCTQRNNTQISKQIPVLHISLGIGFGILFLAIAAYWIYLSIKKRNLLKLREKFFKQNGGFQLMKQVSSQKIFTAKELEIATNNYDQHRILGKGGYGIVYKGSIAGVGDVAIKKSKFLDRSQIMEFINEVVILTQIDHRNIVKLLGCCLESEVPLLVYEFVSNGTLFHHIRKECSNMSMSWANRLRVAAEIAGALSYLHSAASTPIIHRDVKSSNILLDDNLTAKVADFGTSRLNPSDQTQITTLVKGTMGYLDPEYFHTSMLTEKSDVYSFGVVLAELLTGEVPISFERSQLERNLATYFTVSVIENNLLRVLDVGLANEENTYQVSVVAELTKRCLSLKGEERPTMKEVAAELDGLRGFERHSVGVGRQCNEETVITESTLADQYPNSSSSYGDGTSAQYSLEMEVVATSMNIPR